jgi:hypothetical protein
MKRARRGTISKELSTPFYRDALAISSGLWTHSSFVPSESGGYHGTRRVGNFRKASTLAGEVLADHRLASMFSEIAMASCAYCGNMILFGGVTQGDLRLCNMICQCNGGVLSAAATVPESAAPGLDRQIHFGPCPRCQGPGPVDDHNALWVWSALAFSRRGSQQHLACRRCAFKSQLGNLLFSAGLGWWGFPWSLMLTPVQVVRNMIGIVSPPDPSQPSLRLVQRARVQLASQSKN